MGSLFIGQSNDHARLRNLLIVAIVSTMGLVIARVAIPATYLGASASGRPPKLATPSIQPNPRTYRANIPPKKVFVPKLVRSEYNNMSLIDMNDRGDFLFLASQPGATSREFVHVFNGKMVRSGPVSPDNRWLLTSSGNLVKRIASGRMSPFPQSRLMIGSVFSWPFNELRFMSIFQDDGCKT